MQRIKDILSTLSNTSHTISQSEVSYVDFIDRIHLSDITLQENADLQNNVTHSVNQHSLEVLCLIGEFYL